MQLIRNNETRIYGNGYWVTTKKAKRYKKDKKV